MPIIFCYEANVLTFKRITFYRKNVNIDYSVWNISVVFVFQLTADDPCLFFIAVIMFIWYFLLAASHSVFQLSSSRSVIDIHLFYYLPESTIMFVKSSICRCLIRFLSELFELDENSSDNSVGTQGLIVFQQNFVMLTGCHVWDAALIISWSLDVM